MCGQTQTPADVPQAKPRVGNLDEGWIRLVGKGGEPMNSELARKRKEGDRPPVGRHA